MQQDLRYKLEEINAHIEQVLIAQEELVRAQLASDVQCRERLNRSAAELKMQLNQSEADRGIVLNEAKKYMVCREGMHNVFYIQYMNVWVGNYHSCLCETIQECISLLCFRNILF